MKTIDQEREQGRKGCVMMFLFGLIILVSLLFFLAWLFTDGKPEAEPQATLIPDVASQHRPSVGGDWINVEEEKF